MLKIMANCGLRVSEVTNLRAHAINRNTGDFRIQNGKGGKDRDLRANKETLAILNEWEDKAPENDWFFPTMAGKKQSTRSVQYMVKHCVQLSGLNKKITPHCLRHFFATEHYRIKKDLEKLRMLLGHEDIRTTQIYINLGSEEAKESMADFPAV